MTIRTLILILLLAALPTSVATAQEQIPTDSLLALQDMFGSVRDQLWEYNDYYWHQGQFARCIEMMRLITRIDPHDIEAYDGGAWLMQNELRDGDAEAFLLEGIANNPDVYDLYFSLGYFYYLHMRFDEAVTYIEIAVSFDAPHFVWNQLAHAYEHLGQISDAMGIWLQSEYANPASNVPSIQLDRMMHGEPASNVPAMVTRSREERRQKNSDSTSPPGISPGGLEN